jgi:hypothetical protein
MNDKLTGELMYALFPHMARTIEGLRQGWVSYRLQDNAAQVVIDTAEAVIRQLGIRRRHPYAEYFWPGTNGQLPQFAAAYVNTNGVSAVDVRQQLLKSGAGITSDIGLALNPDELMLNACSKKRR